MPVAKLFSRKYRPYISYLAVFLLSSIIFYISAVFHFSAELLPAYLIAVNASALILYAYDKNIAGSSAIRIPEKVLYAMAVLGASLGILLGIRFFRHKSRKARFQFILAIILSCQLIVYLGLR